MENDTVVDGWRIRRFQQQLLRIKQDWEEFRSKAVWSP
jgi:hypothetical protein